MSSDEKRFRVFLANCGNPDFEEDPDEPLPETRSGFWVKAATLREASRICGSYIAENDLGGGNWSGGEVRLRESDETVARISYNGRAWAPEDPGMTGNRSEISLDEDFSETRPAL
ncbi:hypothetical protein [Fulvimarina sp. MAC8]|uniref:hypothetical protein n=1 Tax=Fulvimarina sp. MAC8 TaxID=3162874 RepID=UPI0032F0002B